MVDCEVKKTRKHAQNHKQLVKRENMTTTAEKRKEKNTSCDLYKLFKNLGSLEGRPPNFEHLEFTAT